MTTNFSTPTETTIAYERHFNAPIDEVWKAYTEAELVQQWLGFGEFIKNEMDIREGGYYLWVWRLDDGSELQIRGEVIDAEAPHRLVADEYMADEPQPARSAIEFTEVDGGTLMSGIIDFGSKETRDTADASDMADGMEYSFSRMEELLARGQ